MSNNLSLLSSPNRIETPFIKVVLGQYTFGVYQKSKLVSDGQYTGLKVQYPNYVQSLQVKKINGKVNTYTLTFSYPITENDDPNFFDKVFSSISDTREMTLSYGDLSTPSFTYRDEVTMITNVRQDLDMKTPLIKYTVSAVSKAFLGNSGVRTFPAVFDKPSNVIYSILYNNDFGLLEIFPGMRDRALVEAKQLIPQDDKPVQLELKANITPFEYLAYLVNCMQSYNSSGNSLILNNIYTLNINDATSNKNLLDESKEFIFDGQYFEIIKTTKGNDALDTYTIDIGYPSHNIVTQFTSEDNQGYVILYNYNNKINENYYVQRINDRGELEQEFAPIVSSNNNQYKTRPEDKNWWTKITQFPVKVNLTLKGLLRPTILMSYVRLNIFFYGKKYNLSGLYIITQQIDTIDQSGFRTNLSLTRIDGDNEQ